MAKVIGISAFYHDSAAALIIDGEIIVAVQEERFTRVKHTEVFPLASIAFCLKEGNLTIDELDAVVFYDKPFLKFERILETYYTFSPKGLVSFLKAMPVWINQKIFIKKKIIDGLKEIGEFDRKKLKLLFSEHHLSHASSAFFTSPFKEAAILTIDGVGEWATASIGVGNKNAISLKKELHFPHSLGLLYSAFTYYLGFKVNSGEYKLMGLAPYGNPEDEQTLAFITKIKATLVDIKSDGSVWLNQSYFNYATGLRMIKHKKWLDLFGLPPRKEKEAIHAAHCNLALAIQKVTEEVVLKMAAEAKRITGSENICLAGGVALNCVANGKLVESQLFKHVFIQPASGDAGGALGAALAIHSMYFEEERIISEYDAMKGTYLGPSYTDLEVAQMNTAIGAIAVEYSLENEMQKMISEALVKGKVIGWFQGSMEFGPRALGNRSILANAMSAEMQQKVNMKVKKREGFRPFAPAVMEEDAGQYFDLKEKSPYMLVTSQLKEAYRISIPKNYHNLSIKEKLANPRSLFQSITHVDFSARVQTVSRKTNPKFWNLLNEVKKITGHGVLINTSFNVRGEPIVCSPLDAYKCFMNTELDLLVINNFVYKKTDQPDWDDNKKWQLDFQKD